MLRAVDPVAQLSTRRATQSLPTEQEQRLASALQATADAIVAPSGPAGRAGGE